MREGFSHLGRASLWTSALFLVSCAAPAPRGGHIAVVSPGAPPAEAPPVAASGGPMHVIVAESWTGDTTVPRASTVAWRAGRIEAVAPKGTLFQMRGPVDMVALPPGAFVVPGLVDAHAHLEGLGASLQRLALRGDKSAASVADKVAALHKERPAGAWILGRGWDQNLWTPAAWPTAQVLDAAAPGRPVWLRRVDGHAGWASGETLRRAGITAATRDPDGGRILRDAKGAPSGVLVDNAMELVERLIPEPSASELEEAILLAQTHVLERGLTTVHEMGIGAATEAAYRRLDAAGKLKVRVYAMLGDGPDVLARLAVSPEPFDSTKRFRVGGVKLYADGALGSRGAALLRPYADEPKQSGLVTTPKEHMVEVTEAALRHGWQVAVHAIGDRGNRTVLDAFEEAQRAVPEARDARLRVEHAQILDPADIPRFARLGVIASMQPTHATSDMAWVPARLGPERLAGAYAWKSLLASGAHLCAGSDFPVELADPMLGLYAAITRQDGDGHPPGGWLPAQRLSPDEALRAFTAEAAYCARREADLGVIRPGMTADLTVLDRDVTSIPPGEVKDAHVLMTIIGGEIVFRR